MKKLKFFHKTAVLTVVVAATTILSASTPIEPSAPLFGYIPPAVFSKIDLSAGDASAFLPWLAVGYKTGNVFGTSVNSFGKTDVDNPIWDAASLLNNRDWDKRFIVTMDDTGAVVPFREGDLSNSQVDYFGGKDEDKKIKFIRGDQNEEDDKFRTRPSVLGDILGSAPVYVGAPNARYLDPDYLKYYADEADRAGRVYVGANDGMLHAFDAATGNETFAYVPSMLIPTLPKLIEYSHNEASVHNKYVDGPIAVGETKLSSGAWATVLVGTLGSGGKGIFALNVTSDDVIDKEDNNPISGAGNRVMWEKEPTDTGMANLGYTHAGAEIVQMNNGNWAAVIGNGYGSASGKASLLILDINTGNLIKEIVVPDDLANGLSTPTTVDSGEDGMVDYAYAGDLNGNLWKFDLTSNSSSSWALAYSDKPLYSPESLETNNDGSTFIKQSITTKPAVSFHPNGSSAGVMVYFGTGRLLAASDQTNRSRHHVHGIWDSATWTTRTTSTVDGEEVTTGQVPIRKKDLLEQAMIEVIHQDGIHTARIVSDKRPSWSSGYTGTDTHLGWITPVDPKNIAGSRAGARVLQQVTILDKSLQFVTNNPTRPDNDGENWWYQLDRRNGGSAKRLTFDTNGDGVFSATHDSDEKTDDRVKFTIDDPAFIAPPDDPDATPTQKDLFKFPSAVNIGKGFAARPSFGIVNNQLVAALINRLFKPSFVDPVTGDPTPGNEDFGLIGGHMDLDVSSQTYPNPGDATTDEHDHEWDDTYGAIVNFMNIPSDHRSVPDPAGDPAPSVPGSDTDKLFIVTVNNAHLSPGGVLNINGELIPVKDYRARLKRWLNGSGISYFLDKNLSLETQIKIYKLGEPTILEKLHGVEQLHTLKMEFDRGVLGVGGLVGTNTGCIKKNEPTDQGEYRNGALTTQLLDVTHLRNGLGEIYHLDATIADGTGALLLPFQKDLATGNWYPNALNVGGGINAGAGIHKLGYALPEGGAADVNNHKIGDGMMWEATLFWHWDGGCYTTNLVDYAKDFKEETGIDFVQQFDGDIDALYYTLDDDDEIVGGGTPTDPTDPTDPGDGTLPVYNSLPTIPDEELCANDQSDCLVPEQDDTFADFESQRLYWREFIPDQ